MTLQNRVTVPDDVSIWLREVLCQNCAASVLSVGVCENRDGWLVAWGFCGLLAFRFSTVWLLPFTLL